MAGCQTAFSNIVMSCVVFLTLEFITPLFKYTPNAILSAIIISAVINLIDFQAAILIWKIDKFDFIACLGAFFGVIFVSVEIGLLIAVKISRCETFLSYISIYLLTRIWFWVFESWFFLWLLRFPSPLLKFSCKLLDHELLFLEKSLEHPCTETSNSILKQPRSQGFWLWELTPQFTFPTPIT